VHRAAYDESLKSQDGSCAMDKALQMPPLNTAVIKRLAAKYVWWKTPAQAARNPQRVAAQVMNLGDFDDVQVLVESAGTRYLRNVLLSAEIGQFNARSWHYWHYRLGLADPGKVPPLPERKLG
jgi:hypothetical protein